VSHERDTLTAHEFNDWLDAQDYALPGHYSHEQLRTLMFLAFQQGRLAAALAVSPQLKTEETKGDTRMDKPAGTTDTATAPTNEQDSDIPLHVRRELMSAATANGRISYYWLCGLYRRGGAASRQRIDWLEGTAMPHARKQENANGFQKGWHAALSRAGEQCEDIETLRALVPEPCADVADTLPWPASAPQVDTPKWLPIETAPKDGTEVLLTDGAYKRTGYWARRANTWSVDTAVGLKPPTHWLPLPPQQDDTP
jgi:hypothetical protein